MSDVVGEFNKYNKNAHQSHASPNHNKTKLFK